MIKGINHVGLSVADLNRQIAFYRDGLGLEVVEDESFSGPQYEAILALPGATGRVALLKRGALQLELFEFSYPEPKPADPHRPVCNHGITHFCVEVGDIESVCKRLEAAGASFHCPPLTFAGIGRATYARDPEGNVLELLENFPII